MADNKNTTWSLVKRWGEECFKHSNCTPLGSRTPFVPRHLIDVGDDSWEQVKLQQSSEVMKPAQYMTFSHRWGEDVPGTLTTKNLEELSCMIPTNFLSATFRDAIIVTRCLGFKYLWVDSLCIIQDSLEDWATESASMHSIYGNGSYDISALTASDSEAGLLLEKPAYSPIRISMYTEGTEASYILRMADT